MSTPRDQALSRVSEAQQWLGAATTALNMVIGFPGKRSDIDALPQFKALKTHFHVSLGPPPSFLDSLKGFLPFLDEDPLVSILKDIRFKYWDISRALSNASSSFRDAPAEGEGKAATAFVPMKRDGTLRITPLYLKVGALSQVLVVIHEAGHFIGDEFQDWAYRNRNGESDPNKYKNLPVQYAIRNPDSYAYFALQIAKGINRVLDQDE